MDSEATPEARRSERTTKVPGPDHPIEIVRVPSRVVVTVAGRVIADSADALALAEAGHPPVCYLPRRDADMALLARTGHETWCPYKGACGYYSIPLGGERSTNAAWTYEAPHPAVAAIAGHLAFYPDRVDSIELRDG